MGHQHKLALREHLTTPLINLKRENKEKERKRKRKKVGEREKRKCSTSKT
jgi:hypothetical protein